MLPQRCGVVAQRTNGYTCMGADLVMKQGARPSFWKPMMFHVYGDSSDLLVKYFSLLS